MLTDLIECEHIINFALSLKRNKGGHSPHLHIHAADCVLQWNIHYSTPFVFSKIVPIMEEGYVLKFVDKNTITFYIENKKKNYTQL